MCLPSSTPARWHFFVSPQIPARPVDYGAKAAALQIHLTHDLGTFLCQTGGLGRAQAFSSSLDVWFARQVARSLFILTVVTLGLSFWLPVRAGEVMLSSLCGSGYGGTYVYPYYTAYTTSSSCYYKYLSCVLYIQGTPYGCGTGWSIYDQHVDINPADSVSGSHRLCDDTWTFCSTWGYTSDS